MQSRDQVTEQSGFTLLEVLVALTMLGVGLLGLSQVFVVSDRHVGYARDETIGVALAQEIREKILSETYDHIPDIFDGIDTRDPNTLRDPALDWADHLHDRLGEAAWGTVEVDTPEEEVGVPAGMLWIRVTVSWPENAGVASVPMDFALAKIGP